MRNLKKLLAVIVAICVLATFTVPAFAAGASFVNGDKAQKLYDLKLFSGTSTSTYVPNLGGSLTREQGVILLIKLFGEEANALAITDADTVLAKFSDAKKVSAYAKKYLAYAVKTELLKGATETTVEPQGAYTGDMISAIILRKLGFTDVAYNKSTATLAEKKLITAEEATKLANKNLIRDDAVGIMFASLQAADTKGVTIIAKLIAAKIVDEAKAIAAGVIPATPAKPEVVSATTDNLKVAKIVFNKEIDSTTVNTTNVSATGLSSATLGADKKTVYAVMTTKKDQSSTLDFTINNVKDTAGNVVPKTVKTVTFVDTTVPVINGVVAKNAKTLEISASEPIDINMPNPQIISNVKVDGVALIGRAVQDFTKNTITLKLTTAIAAGTHKVEVSGLADFATYKAVTATFNVEVVADTAPPVMTSAKVISTTQIEVTFNELLDETVKGNYTVNGTAVENADYLDLADTSKVTLTLNSNKPLDIGATVEIKIAYDSQVDVVGNKVAASTVFTFKVTDDTTLPTVTAAIDATNKITLTFSKSMAPVGTIKIYKGTATTAEPIIPVGTGSFKPGSSNTVIELAASNTNLATVDPTDVKVNITSMKDGSVRSNVLAEQNITLKALDTKQPVVSSEYLLKKPTASAADDTVTFYFSEAMDTATLNALSNYILVVGADVKGTLATYKDNLGNAAAISSVASDAKSVVIKVPGMRDITGAKFNIYGLKDVAGNFSVAINGILPHDTDTAFAAIKATAVSSTKIEVEFGTAIGNIDPSAFKVVKIDGNSDFAVVTGVTIDSTTKASLTLNVSIGTDPNGKYTLKASTTNYTLATDVFGKAIDQSTSQPIGDKVAPTATATVPTGTTAGAIVVSFSEMVQVDSTKLFDALILRNADGDLKPVDISKVAFTTDGAGNNPAIFNKIVIQLDKTTAYSVEILSKYITDKAAGNTITALAKTSVTTN